MVSKKLQKTKIHLEELYEVHKPDLNNIAKPDEILMGISSVDQVLTFDQTFALATNTFEELVKIWKQHGCKSNILIENKILNFMKFLDTLIPEFNIFYTKRLIDEGLIE